MITSKQSLILVLALMSMLIVTNVKAKQYEVTRSEPVYFKDKQCQQVEIKSDKTTEGAILGGTAGAIGGAVAARLLFGKGGGSAGALIGGGAGALLGGSSGANHVDKQEQCQTLDKVVGYKNFYIRNGKEEVRMSNDKPLLVVEE